MNAPSADYSTFVLCIALVLTALAGLFIRHIDKYERTRREYIGNKGERK